MLASMLAPTKALRDAMLHHRKHIMANIMQGAAKRAKSYFSKVAALNADIEAGGHIGMAARKDKRKMSDNWVKRNSTNPGQFFNRAAARAAKRNPVSIQRGA